MIFECRQTLEFMAITVYYEHVHKYAIRVFYSFIQNIICFLCSIRVWNSKHMKCNNSVFVYSILADFTRKNSWQFWNSLLYAPNFLFSYQKFSRNHTDLFTGRICDGKLNVRIQQHEKHNVSLFSELSWICPGNCMVCISWNISVYLFNSFGSLYTTLIKDNIYFIKKK